MCGNLQAQLLNKIFKNTDDSTKAMYNRHCAKQENGEYIEKIYYLNDSLYSIATLSSLKTKIRNGKYIEYYKNGAIRLDCNYLKGKKDGKNYAYYENGKMEYDEEYKRGKLNGYLKSYYESGVTRRIDRYSKGKFIEGKCFGSAGQDTSYFTYFKMASFENGNLKKYRNYVMSKLVYPEEAIGREITGTVFVGFVVNTMGKVVDVEVVESPNYYLSKAAVNVVLATPNWEPAIHEGKKVKQQFYIPITFQLQ